MDSCRGSSGKSILPVIIIKIGDPTRLPYQSLSLRSAILPVIIIGIDDPSMILVIIIEIVIVLSLRSAILVSYQSLSLRSAILVSYQLLSIIEIGDPKLSNDMCSKTVADE